MKKYLSLVLCIAVMAVMAIGCAAPAAEPAGEEPATAEEAAPAEEASAAEEFTADLDAIGDKVLRIATPGSYRPFTIFDEASEEWSGFEIDLWREIAERNGFEVEFVRIDIPGAFGEVDIGNADTVAKQVSITPARLEKYDFTRPFFFSPYCLTVAEDNDDITCWADMDGKTIALAEGSAMNEFVAALDPDNKVNKSVYESSGVILKEVSLGRADACPYAYLVLPYFLENNPELKLKSVDIEHPIYTEVNGYPFARTERGKALRDMVDHTLAEMIQDGGHKAISEKWFNIDVMETEPAKEYMAANAQ